PEPAPHPGLAGVASDGAAAAGRSPLGARPAEVRRRSVAAPGLGHSPQQPAPAARAAVAARPSSAPVVTAAPRQSAWPPSGPAAWAAARDRHASGWAPAGVPWRSPGPQGALAAPAAVPAAMDPRPPGDRAQSA